MTATLPQPGMIVVEGTIPAGGGTLLRTAQVADPPAFARTLLIEALGRAGMTTDATPLGSMPVWGEVGSEVDTVPPTSPLKGNARAKSGTTVAADRLNQSLRVMTRGNAGFLTSRSGWEIAFGTYVMYAPMKTIDEVSTVLADVGSVVEAMYEVT